MFKTTARVAGVLAAAAFVFAPGASGAVRTTPGQISCNGSSALCERKLNEVVLPGSHNSMSASELGWFNPNQEYSIPNQLNRGARVLLIDTFYGEPQGNGQVVNVPKAQGRADGAPMYLCHASCLFGNSPLVPELKEVAAFLKANPGEVLIVINEDNVAADDFAAAVEDAGLLGYVHKGPAGPWPTLGAMVESGRRVVMLAQSEVGEVPWYHLAYDGAVRETPYSFIGADPLIRPDQLNESCAPFRGEAAGTSDSLFLMNHWATNSNPGSFEPLISDAEVANTRKALVDRARACEQRRGFLPNMLAVDFFGTGDVVGAARELNGVKSKARLSSPRIRRATARAGRPARLSVPVRNVGDLPATSVKVCAIPPGRLARRPRCLRLGQMLAGSRAKFGFRLATKKKARGNGTVRIRVRSSAGSYKIKARLLVTAAKRRR